MQKIRGKNRQGLALVAVLWIVMILILIAVVMSRSTRLDSRATIAAAEEVRCRWACRAGIEKGIALLTEDSREGDGKTDLWCENETDCNNIALEGCEFTIEITDEASRLNVNAAAEKQLEEIPYLTSEIAQAIIDWRDKDDQPQASGAESGYYLGLRHGYSIRNGPLKTVRELLLVKGVSQEQLYGEESSRFRPAGRRGVPTAGFQETAKNTSPDVRQKGWIEYLSCYSYEINKDALGNNRININKADENQLVDKLGLGKAQAKWIVDNRKNGFKSIADLINENSEKEAPKNAASDKAQPMDLETFGKIADRITITDDNQRAGMVNVNTASREVLAALLDGDESIADSIIDYREGLGAPMTSIADLLKSKDMKIETFKKMANYICTRSNVFRIRCRAVSTVTGAVRRLEAVVDRSAPPGSVLYWQEGVPQ